MLTELRLRSWGLIDDLSLVLGPGMTALTGETGAGKTMVVGALSVLAGARADGVLVRAGADEASVEGRFVDGDDEIVLGRSVPRTGRSRAYLDGRLATATALAESAAQLVELHAQHGHVALLTTAAQRDALDRFAGIDLEPLRAARARVKAAEATLTGLGGDAATRAREVGFLRHQLDELDGAGIDDVGEDDRLAAEEDLLGDAQGHLDALASALDALSTDGGAGEGLATATAALAGRAPLAAAAARLDGVAVELQDVAADLRALTDAIEADPERLAAVQARRHELAELRRRHLGDRARSSTLADLVAYRDEVRRRLDELERQDDLVVEAETAKAAAEADVEREAAVVAAARRAAAPALQAAVESRLADLAMAGARFAVEIGGDAPCDDVTFVLAANPGEPPAPMARAASGGELARVVLALHLVLDVGAGTLVFDEVDAGVGGAAARAVGRALAEVAAERQVLVVTHLPQVAAFADHQVALVKEAVADGTVVRARVLDDHGRRVELTRMLSGLPASGTGQEHADELLATAAAERGR
jgi:DNA repair protein RecN (Recombination protein N)